MAAMRAQISISEEAAGGMNWPVVSTRPEAMVWATAAPVIAPSRLVTVASMMAWRGVSTLVPTTVAMALAVS